MSTDATADWIGDPPRQGKLQTDEIVLARNPNAETDLHAGRDPIPPQELTDWSKLTHFAPPFEIPIHDALTDIGIFEPGVQYHVQITNFRPDGGPTINFYSDTEPEITHDPIEPIAYSPEPMRSHDLNGGWKGLVHAERVYNETESTQGTTEYQLSPYDSSDQPTQQSTVLIPRAIGHAFSIGGAMVVWGFKRHHPIARIDLPILEESYPTYEPLPEDTPFVNANSLREPQTGLGLGSHEYEPLGKARINNIGEVLARNTDLHGVAVPDGVDFNVGEIVEWRIALLESGQQKWMLNRVPATRLTEAQATETNTPFVPTWLLPSKQYRSAAPVISVNNTRYVTIPGALVQNIRSSTNREGLWINDHDGDSVIL